MLPSRRRRAVRTSLAIALACIAPLAHAAGPKPPADYDQFIVKFKDGERATAAQRQQRLDAAAHAQGLHVGQLRRLAVGAHVVKTDRVLDAAGIRAFIGRLRADPRVEYAEVDTRMAAHYVPNDTFYATQWHYHEATAGIGTEAAWGLADGNGQVVAVIDTGITAHSDLDGNVIAGYDFITAPFVANDGDGRDADPSDPGDWVTANECLTGNPARNSSWHGTHVAGTVAAVTNNAKGVAGVAFGATVMPVRVLGKCGGSSSDISDAIVWASGGVVFDAAPNPTQADVINLSLGGAGACGASTQAAINVAVARGSVVVVSAGNNNADAGNYTPANCNNVLSVAALGRTGARASYSNYGSVVDIAAPGGDGSNAVWSTINAGTTVPGAEGYAGYNGTSMAAPHVAGVAALIGDAADGTLDPEEIMMLIRETARPIPVPCAQGCGAGLVDAASAVVMASQPLLTISDPVAAEGNAGTQLLTFTVSLSSPALADVTYYASVSNGTAHAGSDYVANAWADQVIPAGGTSASYQVVVNGDTAAEIDETFSFVVSDVSGPVSVLEDVGTATIVNDDGAAPDISISDATITEGDSGNQQLAFTVNLSFASASAVTYEIATANGTATAGSDFVARALAADSIAAGQTSKTYNVTIKGDTIAESDEVFYVNLYNASGAALVDNTGVGTIADNDRPTLSISEAAFVTEGDSGTKAMTFTVSLSKPAAVPVEFDFVSYSSGSTLSPATGGVDFVENTNFDEVIPAGQLAKTFSVLLNGDTEVEANERLIAQIGNATVDIVRAWSEGVILNDDGPLLSIADAGVVEGNGGTKSLVFTVSLSQVSASPVSYSIQTSDGTASAGSDYVHKALVGEVIPAGQTSKTFAVTLNGDTQVEGNETVFVVLSGIGGATAVDAQARGKIVNDDGPVLSIADATLAEGNAGSTVMTFVVSLSQVAPAPVSFNFSTANGTASAGPDFVPITYTGLKIPAGQLSRLVTVHIKGDVAVEPDETLLGNISLGNVSIKDGVGIGTITNDD